MRGYYSKTQKVQLIEEYRGSGKTIREFTAEKGIMESTFSKWLYRAKADDDCSLVEVKLEAEIPDEKSITVKKSGLEIIIPLSLSEEEIKKILRMAVAV